MSTGKAVDKLFTFIILLKGIHASIEIFLGIVLFVLSEETIANVIIAFVEGRLAGDPTGFVAGHITQFGIDLSFGVKIFLAVYLLSHGIVNLTMVYGVIKQPSWAYPISLVLFIGFLIYQIHSYLEISTAWMLTITILDILFIVLLFYEYNNHLKKYSFLGKLKLIAVAKVPQIIHLRIPSIKIKIEYPKEEGEMPSAVFIDKDELPKQIYDDK
jgi:uncharacterized membrane protein